MFVQKICAFNVDEIDTYRAFYCADLQKITFALNLVQLISLYYY